MYAGSSLNLNLTGSGSTSGVWEGDFIRKTHESLVGRVSNVELGDLLLLMRKPTMQLMSVQLLPEVVLIKHQQED